MYKLLLILVLVSDATSAQIMGYAYPQHSPGSSSLLYTELHQYQGKIHHVIYKTAQEKEFARKTIDYTFGLSTPDIEFSNDNCDERYLLTHQPDNTTEAAAESTLKIDYYNGCDQKQINSTVELQAPYVVDAGFDHFIRQQQETIRHQKVRFSYPLPSRAESALLIAASVHCSDLKNIFSAHLQQNSLHKGAELLWHDCVKVVPNSWLLAQLLPPIYLAYSQNNSLQLFVGNSNIGDAAGDYKKVVIFYRSVKDSIVIH